MIGKPKINSKNIWWNLLNVQSTYTMDQQRAQMGSGVYSEEEWRSARLEVEFLNSPSSESFQSLFQSNVHQIRSTQRLLQKFDFGGVSKIGDIGGFPFRQLIVILEEFPKIESVATEFDSKTVTEFSRHFKNLKTIILKFPDNSERYIEPTELNARIDFLPWDAISGRLDVFSSCDVLTAWGVDYALEDESLLRLFSYIREKNKVLILASINRLPWSFFLNQMIKQNHFLRLLTFRDTSLKYRRHGFFRSQSYFKALANGVEVTTTRIMKDETYTILLFK